MTPIKDYTVVEGLSVAKLNAQIRHYLEMGYRPHGSASMHLAFNNGPLYLQGMVLYELEE